MDIDFVVTWVDGSDPVWQAEKAKYRLGGSATSAPLREKTPAPATQDSANSDARYRDFDTMRYWFRAVEKFAPWVRKVFFVTAGQRPPWLDVNAPKLVLADHRDFIPAEYLPTFNSRTIELNLHRIPSLAEHFVLFNDDMFLLQSVSPDFYFKDSLPLLPCDLSYPRQVGYNNWSRAIFNSYAVLHLYNNPAEGIWRNWRKWFNPVALGPARAAKNLFCHLSNGMLPIKGWGHLTFPHLKSTLAEIWERAPKPMDATCRHKFRADDQVNQWLLSAWNLANGRFSPMRGDNRGENVSLSTKTVDRIVGLIKNRSVPQICVNDSEANDDPVRLGEAFRAALESAFPEPSTFEVR